jgi:hypothetical protein
LMKTNLQYICTRKLRLLSTLKNLSQLPTIFKNDSRWFEQYQFRNFSHNHDDTFHMKKLTKL